MEKVFLRLKRRFEIFTERLARAPVHKGKIALRRYERQVCQELYCFPYSARFASRPAGNDGVIIEMAYIYLAGGAPVVISGDGDELTAAQKFHAFVGIRPVADDIARHHISSTALFSISSRTFCKADRLE